MAFIRRDSQFCLSSSLDLFALEPTQISIENGRWSEFHPLSNIRDGGPIEFNISGSGDGYLDLSKTQLYVKVKILKPDGTNLDEKDSVAPINLFLHSLFSQVDVSLNERLISSSSNTYPYRAYIETLLNYGEDAKKSTLTTECFYKDTAGYLHETDPIKSANSGLSKRHELIKNSHVLDMIGNLHCDLFHQNRLLLNLVDVKIKLIRSKPAFCLLSPANDYNIAIEHASLFVRKVKVSPGVSLGHAKALEKTTAKYPIDRVLCKVYSVPQGSMSFVQDNVFIGQMPKKIVLAIVDNDAFNGTYTSNPLEFKHHHVNFVGVYIDGNPIPYRPLEPDFTQNTTIRAYHSLFAGTEILNQDRGIHIARDEFPKGYALYAFNLLPDLCDGGYMHLMHQGNLRIELKFRTALSKTVSIIVYSEFQNVIEITKSRSVICDFSN